ncbi:MAG: DUF4097 domain-containing protein [Gemmatimonadaceae bacterium]|jgi:hypothetical protein|nr:DUF4097 domain-containing protein [Gemmatimonadaceae bacterium]
MPRRHLIFLVLLGLPALAQGQRAPQQVTMEGLEFSTWNLAGRTRIERATGDRATVEVTRHGRDADRLRIEQIELRGTPALVVRYPDDDIAYDGGGAGSTTVRVNRDGTWGGDGDRWRRGDETRISRRARGTEAWADVVIRVPATARVAAYQAVGSVDVSNVTVATVRADVHSASVELSDVRGDVMVDAGSGDTRARNVTGRLHVDVGSGRTTLQLVRGPRVFVDAGSGDVELSDVVADEVMIDIGSGGTVMRGIDARVLRVDSGSGTVHADVLRTNADIDVDTGSGGVELTLPDGFDARVEIDTGSGGVESELPITLGRADRTSLSGRMGAGSGRLHVDTGSGRVRLRRAR